MVKIAIRVKSAKEYWAWSYVCPDGVLRAAICRECGGQYLTTDTHQETIGPVCPGCIARTETCGVPSQQQAGQARPAV